MKSLACVLRSLWNSSIPNVRAFEAILAAGNVFDREAELHEELVASVA